MFNILLTISQDITKKFDQSTEGTTTLKDVLLDEMRDIYGEGAAEKYEQIKLFLERTDANHREIAEGKLEGRSSQSWLKGRLKTGEKTFPGLTEGIIDGLEGPDGGEDEHEVLDVKNSFDFDIMTSNIQQDIEIEAFSEVLTIDTTMDEVSTSEESSHEGYPRLTNALKSDLNSEEDREMKQLLTVSALKFIQKADEDSILKKLDHVQTSFVVDAAYTSVKVAYKVADKSLTSEEAVDFLVDRGVARLESLVHVTCTNIGGKVGTQVGRVIGGVFGPAGSALGGIVGNTIGKMAGKKVGDVIVTGMKKIVPIVKSGLKHYVEKAKNKVKEKVKGVLSNIFWR